jgi:hypothetical protein
MGWEPKTKLKNLIELVVDADLSSPPRWGRSSLLTQKVP